LRSVLDGKIRSYRQSHPGTVVEIGAARFTGLSRIELENIVLRSDAGTITMDLRSCSIHLSFWNMLIARVRLKRLELDDLQLGLHQASSPQPLPARPAPQGGGGASARQPATAAVAAAPVRQGDGGNSARPGPPPEFAARVAYLLNVFFTRVPDAFIIQGLTIRSDMDQVKQTLQIPRLEIAGTDFATMIEINDLEKKRAYYLTGIIDRTKKRLAIHLLPLRRGAAAVLPFIDKQWGLRASFDSLSIGLESRGSNGGVLRLEGSLAVNGLALNHPRIAAEDVNLPEAALDYVLNIGPDYFELDDRTLVTFDKLRFHPYLKLKTRPTRQVTLKIKRTSFPADDLFSSLPAGLFTRLAGMRTSGELAYHLDFAIDLARPETVKLESELERIDFKIVHFGRVDFRAVNAPFLYTAYEKDRAVRSFVVGPENPDFRFLDQIPACLQNAVMISEDGAFFEHRGFLMEPIKDAIVANLRQGRFARGASTISMQLVKNLYLKRQKTMARKLEEMLITWLIEEKRLISKERMFEIYLNIIEWGPGVYGAQEAARFYFAKDVAGITLPEAVFMASIIPRPKYFMYSFDENRHLRPWLQHYYADVSGKMLRKQWITQEDHDALVPDVRLKGPARLLLKGNEEAAQEPLEEDEPDWP
ncbi:MAG TPA: transglycosylase domain-containing protein, partial [Acidobacteriota bacterium]